MKSAETKTEITGIVILILVSLILLSPLALATFSKTPERTTLLEGSEIR